MNDPREITAPTEDSISLHLLPARYQQTLDWATRYLHDVRKSPLHLTEDNPRLIFDWPAFDEPLISMSDAVWLDKRFGDGKLIPVPVVVISEFQDEARTLDKFTILVWGENPHIIHVGRILGHPYEISNGSQFNYVCCYPRDHDAPQFARW